MLRQNKSDLKFLLCRIFNLQVGLLTIGYDFKILQWVEVILDFLKTLRLFS